MKLQYNDGEHSYYADGVLVPSLTQMLTADGLTDHLERVPRDVLWAKAEWGTLLHLALQRVEYGFEALPGFKQHSADWLKVCERMGWGKDHSPIWKNCEVPTLASVDGFVFGFTPDRAAPEAIVEIKGCAPRVSHGIQVALQVLGMGYPLDTKRYVAYFDRDGLKKLHLCGPTVKRDNWEVDVFADCKRIIFERALAMEAV